MNGFRNYGSGVQQNLDWMRRLERERLAAGWWYQEQQNRIAQQKRAQRNSPLQPYGSQGFVTPGILSNTVYKLITLVCPVEGCKTPSISTFRYKICWCPVHNKILVDKCHLVAARRTAFFR